MGLLAAIGVLLGAAGIVLLVNLFGAGDYVIRRVTSRYLGTLPPGFAASRRGFRIYAVLILALGLVCLGLGLIERVLPVARRLP